MDMTQSTPSHKLMFVQCWMDVVTGHCHYGRRLYSDAAKLIVFVPSSGDWTKILFKGTLALDVGATANRLYEGWAHGRYHHLGSHRINV